MRSIRFVTLLVFFSGCVQTIAIRTVGGILDYGFEAFNEEEDVQLAQEALGSNLKLLEALIKGDPGNEELLLLASRGFSAYALAFVEDDSVERARALYLRAREYALRVLNENETFRDAFGKDVNSFVQSLESFDDDDVPAVFWTAFAWGSYINLTRTEASAIADIPRVNAMMEFVLKRDRAYYYAGALVYLGSIYGNTPVMLGGNPERSKQYFEEALSLTEGKFLLTYVYYARSYAVQTLDEALFTELLQKVQDTPADVLPEARLPNMIAKRKASLLQAHASDFF